MQSQVTFRCEQGRPVAIDAVVLSTQHAPDIKPDTLQEAVMEEIIKAVLPSEWLTKQTRYFINPTGQFIIGGPMGDRTDGAENYADTYGGMARHGGGASPARTCLRWIAVPLMHRAMSQKYCSS